VRLSLVTAVNLSYSNAGVCKYSFITSVHDLTAHKIEQSPMCVIHFEKKFLFVIISQMHIDALRNSSEAFAVFGFRHWRSVKILLKA